MENDKNELRSRRRYLRKNSTVVEIELWKYIKGRQVCSLKFRRQHSILTYIIDFYCPQIKLGIELDGEWHKYSQAYDEVRDEKLSQLGITILRYENRMVFEHLDTILKDIEAFYSHISNTK